MALGKLPVPGRPTIWMIVGQGPTALAVGAGGGLDLPKSVNKLISDSHLFFFFQILEREKKGRKYLKLC